MLEDIPKFLQIPQSERKAAWEKFRQAAKPLPAEPAPRRITSPPGAKDDDPNT